MRKSITAFFLGVLFCLHLLSGCAEQVVPPQPDSPDSPDSGSEQTIPYTVKLHSLVQIFDAPGYDGCYVGCVGEDGIYTITEQQTDTEDHLWGKLKSGIGWVELSALAQGSPVHGGMASEDMLQKAHHFVAVDSADGSQYIVFQATELLSDVRLSLFSLDENGMLAENVLHTMAQLTTEQPLVAQVVFYGDFTLYGLSFTDQSGRQRTFTLGISGRNGAPVLQELSS